MFRVENSALVSHPLLRLNGHLLVFRSGSCDVQVEPVLKFEDFRDVEDYDGSVEVIYHELQVFVQGGDRVVEPEVVDRVAGRVELNFGVVRVLRHVGVVCEVEV